MCLEYLKSSIGKKQVVAVTGLLLIFFIIGHLAGNLFIFGGPEAYNHYAKKLASLRPGLYVIEFTLAVVFLIHIYVTLLLVHENLKSRPIAYNRYQPKGGHTWMARLMSISGTILVLFVIWHLLDFTFVNHQGWRSFLPDGKSYGLYGVVFNALANPFHSLFYILAMMSLGLHLAHGLQSFAQTFGFNDPSYTPLVHKISNYFGVIVALGYSSIPLFVLFLAY